MNEFGLSQIPEEWQMAVVTLYLIILITFSPLIIGLGISAFDNIKEKTRQWIDSAVKEIKDRRKDC